MAGNEGIPTWRNHAVIVMETEFDFSPDETVEVLTKILDGHQVPMGEKGDGIKYTVLGVYPHEEPVP